MKPLSLLLLLPAVHAMAAVTAVATPGTYELFRGETRLSTHPSYEACEGAARALAKGGSYVCRGATRIDVSVSTDATGDGTSVNASHSLDADASLMPAAQPGYAELRVRPTDERAPASNTGAFRTVCGFSHMASDDPIVFPGQPGRSHLHTFFGNTGTNAASTPESLRGSGNSTCRGGIFNRSAYWVPALIDTRDGRPLVPREANVYYKTGYLGVKPSDVRPMPRGLRMVAGDVTNQDPQRGQRWNCRVPDQNLPWQVGVVADCPVGAVLVQEISFPQCWNGRDLDSADHRSHMAYARKGCPVSHPVALPEVTMHVGYVIAEPGQAKRLRLVSDMYDAAKPAGLSSHGDWYNGWSDGASEAWTRGCLNASRDCHSHLVGDGREIY